MRDRVGPHPNHGAAQRQALESMAAVEPDGAETTLDDLVNMPPSLVLRLLQSLAAEVVSLRADVAELDRRGPPASPPGNQANRP